MKWLLVVALVAAGCGGRRGRSTTAVPQTPVATSVRDWMTAVLPEGAQIVVEVDLARLRANPAIGDVATHLLDSLDTETHVPGFPAVVAGSPLAKAGSLVLAAYGVGTRDAATLLVLATSSDVAGAVRITKDLVVLGPPDWADQVAQRAAIAGLAPDVPAPLGGKLPIVLAAELERLRDHAMPAKAPGAVLRISARLPFDARIAFARMTGLEAAPARLSVWADVVDDAAVIIDADAADPGEKNVKAARAQVTASLKRMLAAIALDPAIRGIGLGNQIAGARFIEQGTWVRAIIEVAPRPLARAAQRARAMLPPAS
jgi:hypothetical protein